MCLINGAINILVFVMLNTPKSKVETHIDAEDQVYSGGHKVCCLDGGSAAVLFFEGRTLPQYINWEMYEYSFSYPGITVSTSPHLDERPRIAPVKDFDPG